MSAPGTYAQCVTPLRRQHHRDTSRDTYTAPCGTVWTRITCECGQVAAAKTAHAAESRFIDHLMICGRVSSGHATQPNGCGCERCTEVRAEDALDMQRQEVWFPEAEPPVMS